MNNRTITIIFLMALPAAACNKKGHPKRSPETASVKPVKRATVKTAIPKVITVNEKAAKRSVDGRYYYDLEGHRYWRNNRDGRYYLFNKSMFDNPDFKSRGN